MYVIMRRQWKSEKFKWLTGFRFRPTCLWDNNSNETRPINSSNIYFQCIMSELFCFMLFLLLDLLRVPVPFYVAFKTFGCFVNFRLSLRDIGFVYTSCIYCIVFKICCNRTMRPCRLFCYPLCLVLFWTFLASDEALMANGHLLYTLAYLLETRYLTIWETLPQPFSFSV